MKKPASRKPSRVASDELKPEYRFDYGRSKPNRFAGRLGKGTVVVVLDPDVAAIFKDSASVNALLRSAAKAKLQQKTKRAHERLKLAHARKKSGKRAAPRRTASTNGNKSS